MSKSETEQRLELAASTLKLASLTLAKLSEEVSLALAISRGEIPLKKPGPEGEGSG